MALVAQNRSLVIEIMTGDADFMGSFFTPPLNFLALSIMTMKAVILGKFLMFPVLEGHINISHFEVHYFRTGTFHCSRQNSRSYAEESQNQNHRQVTMHN
jgi:hypothetical protein